MLEKIFSLRNISYLYVICAIALSNVTDSVNELQRVCLGITSVSFIFLLVVYMFKCRFNHIKGGGLFMLILFTFYVYLSSVIAEYEFSLITQALMLLSCILFSSIYETEEDYIGFLKAIVIADVIMAGLLMFMAGSIDNFLLIVSDDELSNLLIQKNIIAFSMSVGSIVCIYMALFYRQRLFYIFLVLFILILFCTGSRRGLFTMFIGIACIYYYYSSIKKINLIKFFFSVACAIIVFVSLLQLEVFSSMNERFTNLVAGLSDKTEMTDSDKIRFLMIQKGFEMFLEKPILGHGANAFKYKAGFGIYSHNNYIELLTNYGIIGFTLFYGFMLTILKKSYYYINRYKLFFCVFISVFFCVRLISDIGNVSYYDKFLYVMFGVSMSYFQNLKGNEKRIA